ncbi:MAG: S-layer homology domain-containing protein [Gracilibacteraceae bacterium]|jgi:hypothetical protein|nr:S-layer homology domain-containing protein [Gracilibacteraceae bacterium]
MVKFGYRALLPGVALLCFLLAAGPLLAAAGATPATARIAAVDAAELAAVLDALRFDLSTEGALPLTRGEFAQMLVKASVYKGLALTGARISPYSDAPYTHPAAPYIAVAAKQGLLSAYSTGKFLPDQAVKYEEALAAALKLLGYTAEDFVGGYPYGQIALATEKNLTDGVGAVAGDGMTKQDGAFLLYNLLCAAPKSGSGTYAESLGYSVESGVLSLRDIRSQNMKGPLTLTNQSQIDLLGVGADPAIYLDGKPAERSELEPYFIIYYDPNTETVAAYSEKIKGHVTSVSPDNDLPTTVMIDDVSYELATYSARQAFGLGRLGEDDYVILLLGRDGKVADAYAELDY